ncbi:Peptidoglycan/LPS O-acetylase OafA/YrhL, contains acyltransferase and SGNH-hydrolase domains [Mitsuaria sp. PDC51]|nr:MULTISPECIES: acyltransferase [unclassified Roseateles]MBB3294074.1 peptidoglycan/LPS O-acetylase OafA/YrhL [Mitsuaria sp. BK041]MBB3363291.1 peptidoglycan/LPS O-acetylase OafA/YrhL [Mitsuaria sp. BK045]SFR98640.1 Peptidoglycan/LPS O-acetylase OafA/YrhL, contains acyltransferase and SGNH-hydrolase domains [Mitsuaria sp. PDC51]
MNAVPRLAQVDALRGIAALAVVLFHYTTRYDQLFGHAQPLRIAVPFGHLGVNLFFMISGFVIFMTLERTARPMDFVVSRFSRLYPAYWGALLLSFALTHLLGLPGMTVGWEVLLANVTMVQGFFGVPHVDNVYWTLEVELLFYCWALASFRLGGGVGLRNFLFACLALRLVYAAALLAWGVDLPWIGQRWLLLPYIAWFALGVAVYRLSRAGGSADRALVAAALLAIGLADGWALAALAAVFLVVLQGAARGRWTWLEHPLLLWLGTISYTLYLLHENIGWALLHRLEGWGVPTQLAIALAMAVSAGLAHGLTRLVELPAMRWIRDRYRARSPRPGAAPAQG